jgi:hypothetical protein
MRILFFGLVFCILPGFAFSMIYDCRLKSSERIYDEELQRYVDKANSNVDKSIEWNTVESWRKDIIAPFAGEISIRATVFKLDDVEFGLVISGDDTTQGGRIAYTYSRFGDLVAQLYYVMTRENRRFRSHFLCLLTN